MCLGLALSVGAVAQASEPTETKHLVVVASTPAPVAPGARVSLTLDVTPKPGMHVYAPGQKEFVSISLTIQADPAITARAAQFPRPEKLQINALDPAQLVYSKPFRIVQDVTPAARGGARAPGATVTIKGTLRYQACDDVICYVPVNVPVAWTIALKPSAR